MPDGSYTLQQIHLSTGMLDGWHTLHPEILLSGDFCSEGVQASVDIFVSAVDLVNIADDAGSVGGHGGDQQGDTGTYIR